MATTVSSCWLLYFLSFSSLFLAALAYEVPILDTGELAASESIPTTYPRPDYYRQVCTGMWASKSTYINVSFDATSQGQVAMVIYEWADAGYLGKSTDATDDYLPVSITNACALQPFDTCVCSKKTYVCTANSVTEGMCTRDQLGRFILDLPSGKQINQTSFWSARVQLPADKKLTQDTNVTRSAFWNNPAGNPTPPASNYTSPWRRRDLSSEYLPVHQRQTEFTDVYPYTEPIHYIVRKTGYYSIVPVTVNTYSKRAATDVPYHPSYTGRVLFQNTFNGKLPASDYPKVNFYFVMTLVYAIFATVWGWLCFQHQHELLPIQYYLSGLVGLLLIEMVADWGYYRYLNSHGRGTAATVFLIVGK
ncbi:hypothetical protein C0992_011599 [Termitomyces sp. T32_za158]|nr:hypothetical protein C0992_011599 [Termitomyces sp. T32_za158]